jgi:predicted Zn-dependent peptidase
MMYTEPTLKQIAPGVSFAAIPSDRFKTGVLQLQLFLPLRRGQDKTTAANAVLPYLLSRSCEKYPTPRAFAQILARLYGAQQTGYTHKRGDAHSLTLSIQCIDDRFAFAGDTVAAQSVELLLEELLRPLITSETVALEKRLMLERIAAHRDEKMLYAFDRCTDLLLPAQGGGLSALSTEAAVAALTADDVRRAWETALREAVVCIVMTAKTGFDAAEDALRRAFSALHRVPGAVAFSFPPLSETVRRESETQKVEQAKLVLGYRTGQKDLFDGNTACRVMTDMLGGGVYSKYFKVVREEKSLCYTAHSIYDRYSGTILAYAGIDTEKADTARAAMTAQLEAMRQGAFDDALLEASKRALTDANTRIYDKIQSLTNFYATTPLKGKLETPEMRSAEILAVTRDDVICAAQETTLQAEFFLAGEVSA